MKTMYKAALAAICVLGAVGLAQAQEGSAPMSTPPSDAAISATSMGSMPSAGSQAGSPTALTRAQVRNELLRAQKSGELERLNNELYNGQ
ncbi:hypothetical protein BLA9940_04703 [Burkholderia aenigmatica]|uniref:DUF4148 domain-containing protein n=1 Tax=Burkholderia aenigmatica TaxID=2015348 RepID=A0A6J5JQ16_9BURK|nr:MULTISPECIES: DUF4148 domain-containing protein [Burkholderia]AYQ38826.1 hypothetical protein CVS37_12410 [Burkholderia lata]MCA8297052.1 DUF4148 domain-containing protein [Burkholderia sp. AU30198]UKD10292.1 DUF4148 domain-containing protein [Burkholderia aenigmatica]CAB3973257.1 hypothetical protein BLA3211_07398 [Burkholderia aenigmatica]VWC79633.1 hypothetical protein BLA9940_04703 [Burkholderia aenigmatica]